MMMRKVVLGLMAAVATVAAVVAAPAASSAPLVKNTFPRPPAAAVTALQRTVGKPFSAGYVFIDGKYIPPPYKVERYGTVIRINNCQVSSEIVPWEEFVKTQEGVTVTKTETPAAGGGAAAASGDGAVDDLFADDPPASDPESEAEEEEEEEDDSASSLDDLFDDDPKPKKTTPKKKAAKKKKAYKPRVAKPTTTVSYSFEGTFTPNERSKALVTKVNATRTRIDKQLRAGGIYFFGSRYTDISGDSGSSKRILAKLPEIMKQGADRETFGAACRAAGLSYFPVALIDDLHRNRFDYLQLLERRKADQEKSQWQTLLGD